MMSENGSGKNSLLLVEYCNSLKNVVTKVKVTEEQCCCETPEEYLKTLTSGITENILYALTDLYNGGFLTDQYIQEIFLKAKHSQMEQEVKDSLLKTAVVFIGLNQLEIESNTMRALLSRLWEAEGNFQIIYEEMLKPLSDGEIEDFYPRLRFFLRLCGNLTFVDGEEKVTLLNAPLAFGESPLMAACKNKRPGAISLLLRYGANPVCDWLSYTHALQVVLFSPSKRWISEYEKGNIELCVNYILRFTSTLKLTDFTLMTKKGYYPIYEAWRELLERNHAFGPCSLQKLCKLRIRECLKESKSIPLATSRLPLPRTLREYIDLRRDI